MKPIVGLILIAVFSFASFGFAKSKPTAQKQKTVTKSTCLQRELSRQDCRLLVQSNSLRLLASSIAWDDGIWKHVDPMPLGGEATKWEKFQFQLMGQNPILQAWLWDQGIGESKVQSLHWYVIYMKDRKLTVLSDEVVRKRHLSERATPEGSTDKGVKPPHFIYDGLEAHELKLTRTGQLEIKLNGKVTPLRLPVSQ